MHLKLDAAGTIDTGAAARDLGQPTADIVVLSAADTELAGFAAAAALRTADAPSVAFTNVLALGHPMSVDLYVARTLARAKIVVVRLLGGETYWPHGVASLRAHALAHGTIFCCLSGELAFDDALAARGTLDATASETLWRYCAEGGVENLARALHFAAFLIGRGTMPAPPQPMPAAGFWPQVPMPDGRPVVPILFYRARALGFDLAPIEALAEALAARGLQPMPLYVTSLKDPRSAAFLRAAFAAHPPAVILNTTAFATALSGAPAHALASGACPVLQLACAGTTEAEWRASARGLAPRDLAMHVVMPEVDGRLFAGAISFKAFVEGAPATSRPVPAQVAAAADRAAAWARLRAAPPADRRVALVLANYPNRDGRLGNGVGLDTPASLATILAAMREAGYDIGAAPCAGAALMAILAAGPTNAPGDRAARTGGTTWPVAAYLGALAALPAAVRDAVTARWGAPEADPYVVDGAFRLALHRFGNTIVGVQPARGYAIDPKSSFHDPDLVPPHNYLAFYLWLRAANVHALAHVGKHGNLEWLPGKSTGLSDACFPEAILGAVPHLYPFIVNDPGEGLQAKRRTGAVILDHLPPPMTRAELHGDLAALETLIDEYATAADLDPPRAAALADDILASAQALRMDADLDLARGSSTAESLRALDAHLCDLKEMQIRDGLHVFGQIARRGRDCDALDGRAGPRAARGGACAADASLHRALAADLGLGMASIRSTRDLGRSATTARAPTALRATGRRGLADGRPTRAERIEAAGAGARVAAPRRAHATRVGRRRATVLAWIAADLRPALAGCGRGGDGRLPARARRPLRRARPLRCADARPTGRSADGRNFFAVDLRAVPTPAAWRIGSLAAERIVEAYWQAEGEWPRAIAVSAWGTASMRTGGDDVAQVLALIGARPTWEPASGRVTGFAITPLGALGRPRIDVTLRVSGLFRDAFPTQIDLVDSATRAIAALDEPRRCQSARRPRAGGSRDAAGARRVI